MARQVEGGDRSSLPIFCSECFTKGGVFPCTKVACYSSSHALGNYLEQVNTGHHILVEAPTFAEPLDALGFGASGSLAMGGGGEEKDLGRL